MWTKWFPWRSIIKILARRHGFIDPINLLAAINRIAQPSEVAAPVELLRLAVVLHARGLINSQIIQNNLDWVWPYWVEQQFDPRKTSFIPRAFSLTHINLSHRNWTAVGVPGVEAMPIVDPRGLVTPLYDGWSIDGWLLTENGGALIPSRATAVRQSLEMLENLSVMTDVSDASNYLTSRVEVEMREQLPVCKIILTGNTRQRGRLVVSLRPFNPEGVSFIHSIEKTSYGWLVNGKDRVCFKDVASKHILSDYRKGDVFNRLSESSSAKKIKCDVGLCSAALILDIDEPGTEKNITLEIPLSEEKDKKTRASGMFPEKWPDAMAPVSTLEIPDERFKSLYYASVRNLILLSPGSIYPGPYTYKEFWFRDAVYALNAMLSVNLSERAKKVIDMFPALQSPTGYFRSQDGEWDSNGQVLWIMKRYCEVSGHPPDNAWVGPIRNAINWISRKRISNHKKEKHSGLFPAGFSAEHFGPSDYYYWDDFWGVAGLEAGEFFMDSPGVKNSNKDITADREAFLNSINKSIEAVCKEQSISTVPSSPHRRMDSSAVGVLVADYPLRLYAPGEKMMIDTANYLVANDFVNGLFFHEIAHSGINIYLSLHIAQVLLRAGESGYFPIMEAAAAASSDTGQWPEAINPRTGGGCMGDGQHLWASSEWVMMVRNCFVREEKDALILCSGIPRRWIASGREMFFGPAPTSFGAVNVRISPSAEKVTVHVDACWRGRRPKVEVRIPGYDAAELLDGEGSVDIHGEGA
jgi:hypothetical protein